MNIFLTGITGFIGSHLTPKLNEKGYKVYALLRHSPRAVEIPKYVTSINGDLLDIHSLKKAIREAQPEIIIHTAGMTPVRYSFENPFIYAHTNYIGTMNLVHASLDNPQLEKFIHASTAEVYKPKATPVLETDELFGSTPYGVSKVAGDYYVQIAGKCFGLPYILLRPTNTYGRKTEKGYLIEKVVNQMLTSKKLVLDGNPNVYRDFMYVDDHVNGYLKAVEYKGSQEIFNLSTNRPVRIQDVTDISRTVLNWDGEVFFEGSPRPYDPEALLLDSHKANEKMNWTAGITLEEGIQRVADYWRDKK